MSNTLVVFQNQRRVPFSIPFDEPFGKQALSGETRSLNEHYAVGLVGLEEDRLILQFKVNRPEKRHWSEGLLGPLSSRGHRGTRNGSGGTEAGRVTEVSVPLDDLAAADIKGRWGRTVTLTTNDLKHYDGLPGVAADTMILKIARKNRQRADDLVAELQMRLSELGMERLDNQITELERKPAREPRLPPNDPSRGPD